MKKRDKKRELILNFKRSKKTLKRKNQLNRYKGNNSAYNRKLSIYAKIDSVIIKTCRLKIYEYFAEKNFITMDKVHSNEILIDDTFSFCDNYEYTLNTLKYFVSLIWKYKGKDIKINFKNCTNADQSALFVLQIIKKEFQEELRKLNGRLKILSADVSFTTVPSSNQHVNKLLLVTGLVSSTDLIIDGLMPINSIGYYKGVTNKGSFRENRKGPIGTKLSAYINNCISRHGYEFNATGVNYLEGLISEILNNSEDHSPLNTYYVTANLLGELDSSGNTNHVGELNLSFMNFGYSFYEGFELTKNKNVEMYEQLDLLSDQVNKGIFNHTFSRENLFTLYALQEGISRLKYEDESRGTGSMKFINCFLSFGDYEDTMRGFIPTLSILTGKTLLICTKKYKPQQVDGVFYLALNNECDLSILPDKECLKSLRSHFPGTLLTTKIYLNKDHLTKKILNNG